MVVVVSQDDTPFFYFFYLFGFRFLRMRDFDISKSKEMFLNYLKWCADYGVDTILKVNSGWTLTLSNEHIISLVLRRWIWLKYEAVFGVYLYVRYSCLMDSERSLEYSDNNACYKQVLFKTAGKRLPLYIFGSHHQVDLLYSNFQPRYFKSCLDGWDAWSCLSLYYALLRTYIEHCVGI